MASAEQALNDQRLGVRDEIGFLALHQALSDRFFPGTSVLHTRLRYALFVPWLLERSAGNAKRFHDESLKLTQQLVASREQGVIGARNPQREPAQTPAMIYWSALARWGILHPRPDRATPTRKQVLQRIAAGSHGVPTSGMIDGELAWSPDHSPFARLPPQPGELLRSGQAIDFKLTRIEADFLRRQLMAVCRDDGKQSLLGRLAERRVSMRNADSAWHKTIRQAADEEDKRYLTLATNASALAGIGRAVYSALVELAKNGDGIDQSTRYRDDLKRMRTEHQECALALDLDALSAAVPGLEPALMTVLRETQHWLYSRRQSFLVLEEAYRGAEYERKGARTRLGVTLGAQARRAEWNTPEMPHPTAEPLHYRWGRVRTLLSDLGAA